MFCPLTVQYCHIHFVSSIFGRYYLQLATYLFNNQPLDIGDIDYLSAKLHNKHAKKQRCVVHRINGIAWSVDNLIIV